MTSSTIAAFAVADASVGNGGTLVCSIGSESWSVYHTPSLRFTLRLLHKTPRYRVYLRVLAKAVAKATGREELRGRAEERKASPIPIPGGTSWTMEVLWRQTTGGMRSGVEFDCTTILLIKSRGCHWQYVYSKRVIQCVCKTFCVPHTVHRHSPAGIPFATTPNFPLLRQIIDPRFQIVPH